MRMNIMLTIYYLRPELGGNNTQLKIYINADSNKNEHHVLSNKKDKFCFCYGKNE